jgi:hypothetical protein
VPRKAEAFKEISALIFQKGRAMKEVLKVVAVGTFIVATFGGLGLLLLIPGAQIAGAVVFGASLVAGFGTMAVVK